DSTLAVINEYRDSISVIVSEKDRGMYDALNKGLSYVNGELWASLNADDRYSSGTVLSEVAKIYDEDFSCSIYYGDLNIISSNGERYRRTIDANIKDIVSYGQCSIVTQPASFINCKLNKDVSFDTQYQCASDYDYIVKCALNGPCKRLKICITDFYRHEGSITEKYKSIMKRETDDIAVYYAAQLNLIKLFSIIRKGCLALKRGVVNL
ncbi:MAG: glycosyltransferase, partial [Colwellia sp.]